MCVRTRAGASSGNSPGFGLTLVAETTTGCLLSAEACASHSGGGGAQGSGGDDEAGPSGRGSEGDGSWGGGLMVPEDVGAAAAGALLREVGRGGVVDGAHQGLLLLMAALGPQELAQVGGARAWAGGRGGGGLHPCVRVLLCAHAYRRDAGAQPHIVHATVPPPCRTELGASACCIRMHAYTRAPRRCG